MEQHEFDTELKLEFRSLTDICREDWYGRRIPFGESFSSPSSEDGAETEIDPIFVAGFVCGVLTSRGYVEGAKFLSDDLHQGILTGDGNMEAWLHIFSQIVCGDYPSASHSEIKLNYDGREYIYGLDIFVKVWPRVLNHPEYGALDVVEIGIYAEGGPPTDFYLMKAN